MAPSLLQVYVAKSFNGHIKDLAFDKSQRALNGRGSDFSNGYLIVLVTSPINVITAVRLVGAFSVAPQGSSNTK